MVRRLAVVLLVAGLGASRAGAGDLPDILLLTVDTLRADRLGAYGYDRATSPRIDGLLAEGARFAEARTIEPLTAPALASLITSLHPHDHAATRNGLRMRSDLPSLPKVLARRGYETAAFVGNWTLRDKLLGMAEHFATYHEVLERRRWLGLVRGEATAEDLNAPALAWLDQHLAAPERRPFFLWVHYVEPHAPYFFQPEFASQLGLAAGGKHEASDRYDSEVAFLDHHLGRLLDEVRRRVDGRRLIVAFLSDHGENLGEHGAWGHGRDLLEPGLRIPLGLAWPGRVVPEVVAEPATLLDLAPTLLGLLGLPAPELFAGLDWSGVLAGTESAPAERVTYYQAHRGAVLDRDAPERVRRQGLIEVGLLAAGVKETLRLEGDRRRLFDLGDDSGETASRVEDRSPPSPELVAWLERVQEGLERSDELPPASLDSEDVEALRALGYLD